MSIIRRNESGQGLTEYLILLFLICLAAVTAAKSFGDRVKTKLAEASRHVNSDLTLSSSHGHSHGDSDGGGGGDDDGGGNGE